MLVTVNSSPSFELVVSTPSFEQIHQQPPLLLPATERQDYTYHYRHRLVGPAIGALEVIKVLGTIALMIG
ncbi:hypothetical protein R6Q59_012875 [Mikania micrantha]